MLEIQIFLQIILQTADVVNGYWKVKSYVNGGSKLKPIRIWSHQQFEKIL